MKTEKQIAGNIAELEELTTRGFWKDDVMVDRLIVQKNKCLHCRKNLKYLAFSDIHGTLSFGVCTDCDYVERFKLDNPIMVAVRNFSCKT